MSDDLLLVAVQRVQRGEREAYREVVNASEGAVRLVVGAILPLGHPAVDDVVQDTFITAWNKLGGLRAEAGILAWFTSIARHLALNERRRWLREQAHRHQDPVAELVAEVPVAVLDHGLAEQLERCLAALGDPAREIIVAHYWRNQAAESIAHSHTRPLGWVRVHLSRARAALAACLRHKGAIHD